MRDAATTLLCRVVFLALVAVSAPTRALAQSPPPDSPDVSMVVENVGSPFVTADFAAKLGTLVTQQKYPRVIFASPPSVVDKGDIWWVTFTVKEWPEDMAKLSPGLADHLTFWIRKRDAAILGIH